MDQVDTLIECILLSPSLAHVGVRRVEPAAGVGCHDDVAACRTLPPRPCRNVPATALRTAPTTSTRSRAGGTATSISESQLWTDYNRNGDADMFVGLPDIDESEGPEPTHGTDDQRVHALYVRYNAPAKPRRVRLRVLPLRHLDRPARVG